MCNVPGTVFGSGAQCFLDGLILVTRPLPRAILVTVVLYSPFKTLHGSRAFLFLKGEGEVKSD